MKTIYKYSIGATRTQRIEMPTDAKVLSVQCQAGEPYIWVMVETDLPSKPRAFMLVGTGHFCSDLGGNARYIGTFQIQAGALVFHLFDLGYDSDEVAS